MADHAGEATAEPWEVPEEARALPGGRCTPWRRSDWSKPLLGPSTCAYGRHCRSGAFTPSAGRGQTSRPCRSADKNIWATVKPLGSDQPWAWDEAVRIFSRRKCKLHGPRAISGRGLFLIFCIFCSFLIRYSNVFYVIARNQLNVRYSMGD